MNKGIYNIQVGVPSQDLWMAEFGMSLAFMLTWSVKNRLMARSAAEKVEVINYRGSILPYLREQIVQIAREREATHLLFVDSDQTFPKNLIRRMLGYELPVVACNIPVKRLPAVPTARIAGDAPGGRVLFSNNQDGLQEVWRVGTGVMLIDMEVFDVISAPYFSIYWDASVGHYRGEDWVFCEKCEEVGIPLFIDHTLSREIGHVGSYKYEHKDIQVPQAVQEVKQSSAA